MTSNKKRKKKNDAFNTVIKALAAACVVMAVALVAIIGVAVVQTDAPASDSTVPSTEETTTEPLAQQEASTTQKEETTLKPSTENSVSSKEETTGTEEADTTKRDFTTQPQLDENDRIIVNPEQENWNLVVVNAGRAMPEGYVPKLTTVAGTGVKLDYRVAPWYDKMYNAAKKDGIILVPYSGYRSYERQKINYNNLTEKYMGRYGISRQEAAKRAATVILPPGTSEHNLGLAMDICNTYDSFANQKEYKWLVEHAHEYGFILRYTAEKKPITGIVAEPWHWRYVGVEYAEKIKNSGLCFEEYLDSIGVAY